MPGHLGTALGRLRSSVLVIVGAVTAWAVDQTWEVGTWFGLTSRGWRQYLEVVFAVKSAVVPCFARLVDCDTVNKILSF